MGDKGNDRGRSQGAATTALLIRFDRWYTKHVGAVEEHDHLAAEESRALLGELFQLSSGALRTPTESVLSSVLDAVETDPELSPMMPHLVDTLEHYLDFAVETGMWAPAESEIVASYELLAAAIDEGSGLLLDLIDALELVPDVPAASARQALEALAPVVRSEEDLLTRVQGSLADLDPAGPIGALVIERVLGVLCVAVSPELLPGLATAQILELLDEDAGASVPELALASPLTDTILAGLVQDGILTSDAAGRLVAPVGLRPALADVLLELADEFGLSEGNPHPEGTVLEVTAVLADSEPEVWRRLEIDADADLGELHLALQLTLDWANTEEHRFTTDLEEDGSSGSPADSAGGPDDGSEEDDVEIGELLVEDGDALGYDYDGARVIVTLQRVTEPRASGIPFKLPRCVGASAETGAEEADRLLAPLRVR
jgi:hypothetical protein